MKFMALSTAFVALVQMIGDLYRRFDIDYIEGDAHPRREISWGTCRSLEKSGRYDFRYFLLRLPFYGFAADYETHGSLVRCRLVLFRFAGKWSTYWAPL
jgi:hypothetical protein